jgi:hypothetical protein
MAYKEKEICQETFLSHQNSEKSKNNIIRGDFNVNQNNKEKKGGNIVRDPF